MYVLSVCMYIRICSVYEYVYVYICMLDCAHVCRVHVLCVLYMCTYVNECLVVCCSVLDSFVRSKLSNRRFKFMPVLDPIDWQFEDRSMRWSRDMYWFVQWRPDDDLDPKSRHFMWVFVLMLFSYLPLLLDIGIFILIISCDFILYFTSLTCCITSWDIIDCSPYLCSWYELVSVSFHVLVDDRCWLRPSLGIL